MLLTSLKRAVLKSDILLQTIERDGGMSESKISGKLLIPQNRTINRKLTLSFKVMSNDVSATVNNFNQ